MIDLHCHILPALDDGALDLSDSVAMGRQADGDRIRVVCATPHIRDDHHVDVALLADRVDQLNTELERQGVVARVVTGGEVAETVVGGLSEAELRLVSLGGGGRWILLEPRPGPLSDSLLANLDALAGRGFRVLLAHPERHLGAGAEDVLKHLVSRGALVQVTAADLSEPGSQLLVALAEKGLVHVLGSDAHSARFGRPVRVSPGIAALATVPGLRPHLAWIAHAAPEGIMRGDDVEPPYAAT